MPPCGRPRTTGGSLCRKGSSARVGSTVELEYRLRMKNMVELPGGTFRMGSRSLLPRGAARPRGHGRWLLDRRASGHRRRVPPLREGDRPRHVRRAGARCRAITPTPTRELLVPGSLVFRQSTGPVDLRDYRNWWALDARRRLAASRGARQQRRRPRAASRDARRLRGRDRVRRVGRQGAADRGRVGVRRPRRARRGDLHVGRRVRVRTAG